MAGPHRASVPARPERRRAGPRDPRTGFSMVPVDPAEPLRAEGIDGRELGKTLRGNAQDQAVVSAEVRSSNRHEPERGVRN